MYNRNLNDFIKEFMNDDFFGRSYEINIPKIRTNNLKRRDYSDNTTPTNVYEDEWSYRYELSTPGFTKKDLTSFGSFLIMGLIGIIIASIVNIFMQSSALEFAISVIGVFVFLGLAAYDTQRAKNMYYQVASADSATIQKSAIMNALSLYMDFINLFLMLLRLFGERR